MTGMRPVTSSDDDKVLRRGHLVILPSRSNIWRDREAGEAATVVKEPPVLDLEKMLRVLLVEDEISDAKLLMFSLRRVNEPMFRIEHVTNLGKAVTLIEAGEHFDVVLLDISLPDSFGMETVERMQAVAPRLPIVIMSGRNDPAFVTQALEFGVQDYLVKGEDEAQSVARSIRYAISRKAADLERQALTERIISQQRILMQEIASARSMQFGLLPRAEKLDGLLASLGLGVEAHFEPSSGIGGDLWGVLDYGAGRIGFYAYDFSGHGVGAALNVFRLHALIAELWTAEASPAELLGELGRALAQLLPRGQYATMFLGVFDCRRGVLDWASAGSPAPILVHDGHATLLDSRGVPLGLTKAPSYTDRSIAFGVDDQLVLFSDAVIDAEVQDGTRFGEARLIETAESLLKAGGLSVEGFLDTLFGAVKMPLEDDLTAISITRFGQ